MRQLVLDTETTGLEVGLGHRIIEIGCVELVKDKEKGTMFEDTGRVGTICRDYCIENGLIMRAVRDGMIFCPPLIFSKNHIDELVEKLKKSLDQTHNHINKN